MRALFLLAILGAISYMTFGGQSGSLPFNLSGGGRVMGNALAKYEQTVLPRLKKLALQQGVTAKHRDAIVTRTLKAFDQMKIDALAPSAGQGELYAQKTSQLVLASGQLITDDKLSATEAQEWFALYKTKEPHTMHHRFFGLTGTDKDQEILDDIVWFDAASAAQNKRK